MPERETSPIHRPRRRLPALVASGALAFACALALPAGVRAQDAGGIPVGSKAPVVGVQDLTGRIVQVPSAGAPVLLEFWATWCPNCEELEPRMKAVHAKYGSRVRFYAVAVNVNESPARVSRHVASRKLAYPVYYDASGAATREYDVPATSFVVVTDASGRIVYTGLGGDQKLDAVLARVAPTPRPGGKS